MRTTSSFGNIDKAVIEKRRFIRYQGIVYTLPDFREIVNDIRNKGYEPFIFLGPAYKNNRYKANENFKVKAMEICFMQNAKEYHIEAVKQEFQIHSSVNSYRDFIEQKQREQRKNVTIGSEQYWFAVRNYINLDSPNSTLYPNVYRFVRQIDTYRQSLEKMDNDVSEFLLKLAEAQSNVNSDMNIFRYQNDLNDCPLLIKQIKSHIQTLSQKYPKLFARE